MRFGNLEFIHFLWIVPAVIIFFRYAFKRKKAALEKFSQKNLLKNLVVDVDMKRQKTKSAVLVAVVFLAVIALIDPKWGYHWEEVKRKGTDIVIALDVSKSMLAQDVKPDRLQMAKREIEDFVGVLRGDRVALVTFAGTSFIQCPLTSDYGALKMFLSDVNTGSIPIGGTEIGAAINKALEAFADRTSRHKILILITDGEDHGGEMQRAAERAKKEGLVIYVVGIGSPVGAPIPIKDETGANTFMKDRSGKVILSKVDEEGLKKIAYETGGAYIAASGGMIGLEKIYDDRISKLEKKEFGASKKRVYESRFQIPLALALVLLLIEFVVGDVRRKAEAVK